jgi:hypothetical protein
LKRSEVKKRRKNGSKKTGWKKGTDNEEQEICEMLEVDGEIRVEISGEGKQTSDSGNTACMLTRERIKIGIA